MSTATRLLRRSFSTSLQPKPKLKQLVTDIYNEYDLIQLVQKFKKYSEIDRFRTKIKLYDATIHRLASSQKLDLVEEVLEDQRRFNSVKKEGFNARLITLYGKAGMFDHAKKLFDEFPERKTVLSLNALLAASVNSKEFDKFDEVLRDLVRKGGIEMDLVTYNVVINGLCQKGSFDEAVRVFDEMVEKGFEPDVVSFSTMLYSFYRNNRFADGERMWSLMEKKGVKPNLRCYNSRLYGLIWEKGLARGVEFVDEMRAKKVKPDVATIEMLIKGYCKVGNLEDAKKWFTEIQKCEADPTKVTYAALIPLACKKGELDFAAKLCRQAIHIRCLVEDSLLQSAVNDLGKASKLEEANKIVELATSDSQYEYTLKLPTSEM